VSSIIQTRQILLGDVSYPFHYGSQCLQELTAKIASLEPDRLLVITDTTVAAHYQQSLLPALDRIAPAVMIETEPGERHKTLDLLGRIAEKAILSGITRQSVVVSFGGGVTGNMTGLLAALLFRGIRLIHIPTTLVALFDSVISIKQAVNSRYGKNLVGTYYAPVMVLGDLSLLRSLPAREVRSGVAEVLKNALAIEPNYIDFLLQNLDPRCSYPEHVLRDFLDFSIDAKLKLIKCDKHERHRGLALEYGHTIGHAIELAHSACGSTNEISHGEAVAVGMIAAARIAHTLGLLTYEGVETHCKIIHRAGISSTLPTGLDAGRVLELLRFDNKRGHRHSRPGELDMILLKSLGVPNWLEDLPLTPVPFDAVEVTVRDLAGFEPVSTG
jgi:3-dehydroquinate synthase